MARHAKSKKRDPMSKKAKKKRDSDDTPTDRLPVLRDALRVDIDEKPTPPAASSRGRHRRQK
jgi:hypothetical protein